MASAVARRAKPRVAECLAGVTVPHHTADNESRPIKLAFTKVCRFSAALPELCVFTFHLGFQGYRVEDRDA